MSEFSMELSADQVTLRDELAGRGWIIEDGPGGSTLRRT